MCFLALEIDLATYQNGHYSPPPHLYRIHTDTLFTLSLPLIVDVREFVLIWIDGLRIEGVFLCRISDRNV